MKTAVMTDSNSGIFAEEAQRLGIWSMHMPVIVDGAVRYEGDDISHAEFFAAVDAGAQVSTSQPAPADLKAQWDAILDAGWDGIVYVPMSSALSKSCATAQMLAADYRGLVRVADNRRVSVTQRQAVYDAIHLAQQGLDPVHIANELEMHADESSIYLAVDTLSYLKAGGRISAGAATLATLLDIKPVTTIQGGLIELVGKAHGMAKAVKQMFKAVEKDIKKKILKAAGKEGCTVALTMAGAGLTAAHEMQLLELAREHFPEFVVSYDKLPLSVAVHTGPGAIGLGASAVYGPAPEGAA